MNEDEINKRLDSIKEDVNQMLRVIDFMPFYVGAALLMALGAVLMVVWF